MARMTAAHPLLGSVPAVATEEGAAPLLSGWILVARQLALSAAGRRPPPSVA